MWRLDRREGAAIFAAGCALILPIAQTPETGAFLNRGRLVFGATLVQHHRAFYSRKQPERRLIFRPGRAKKTPAAIETTEFFRGTPERISPFGDKPRIRGAQQKNLPHGRFFVVRPSGFPLSGINLESAAHSKKTCLTAGFLWYARADSNRWPTESESEKCRFLSFDKVAESIENQCFFILPFDNV